MGKQQHIAKRSGNDSTAEQYGFAKVIELANHSEKELTRLPKCKSCHGKGTYKPMFYEMECPDCFGTALNLSDPLAIIKLQSTYLAQSKKVIVAQRQTCMSCFIQKKKDMRNVLKHFMTLSKNEISEFYG